MNHSLDDTRVLVFRGCYSNVRVGLQQNYSSSSTTVFCSYCKRSRVSTAQGTTPLSIQQWGKGVPLQHSAAIWTQQSLLQARGGGETLEGRARQHQQSTEIGKAGAHKQLTALAQFSLFSRYLAVAQTLSPILFTLISPVFPFFFALISINHFTSRVNPWEDKVIIVELMFAIALSV